MSTNNVGGRMWVVGGLGVAGDTRFLMQRRRGWYAVVEVPPSLRGQLGRRLKATLKTTDINLARARRWKAVADLKGQIEAARRGVQGDPLTLEALAYREALEGERHRSDEAEARAYDRALATGRDEREAMEAALGVRTDDILRDHVGERVAAIARDQGSDAAQTFAGIVSGKLTPLATHVDAWLSEGGAKGPLMHRTKIEHRRAVRELGEWMSGAKLAPSIETVTRRIAARFVAEHLLPSGRHRRTIAKAVSTLSVYWQWLQRRGHIDIDAPNPWTGQKPPVAALRSGDLGEERAFTDDEMRRLFASPPNDLLAEFMTVAALTGMRRESIGQLTVADCAGGIFVVRKSTKTTAGRRRIPIHPALVPLVERRSAGKAPNAYLFHELRSGTTERTDPIGKLFMRYRRSLGIQEGEGRRSLVNFHSFRRWFVTAAINAGQPPHVVSLLAGHEEGRRGMTLATYWAGSEDAALRACVEAVKLPAARMASPPAAEPE